MMKTPPLDQTEGRKEGNLVKILSRTKIQRLRKRSLQAPPKMLSNPIISLLASLPMHRSQKPERPPTPDPDWSKRRQVDFRPPQTWISQVACAEEPPTSFDEFNDTSFDFSAFVLNRLKIPNLTQEILCSKAITKRLDWHNPENKPYPFNLRKPIMLIQDHRGRQITPNDYFINKDLEYLEGEDLSRRYSTSVTKIKAATYELKWIEDLVPELWSAVQLKYDQHAYFGTSHWGPKRQSFYGYASNLTSSKDVYSIRRIITVTRLTIMKKRIVIQRRVEDLQLGVESYQKKLNLTKPDTYRSNLKNKTAYTSHSDPHGIIYVDRYKGKRLMRADELHKFSNGMFNDVRTALHDIAAGVRIEYLPMRKWSNLDKKRARVMVQDIDKQLYQRRLMQNLEMFIGGRIYGKDLRLLERTI
ncbi:hypothetical protein Tco_0511150 [Tanacetum coccineum]